MFWLRAIGESFVLLGMVFVTFLAYQKEWIPLLDGANLIFHEAGHVIFSFGGEFVGLLGGTIGQLAIPLIVLVAFARTKQHFSTNVALWWFGQNLVNVAVYIGDARAQVLPLLGEGHDWFQILTKMGLLEADTRISGAVFAAGMIVMIVGLWFALQTIYLALKRRTRADELL